MLTANLINAQSTWFKHVEGFSARQSFVIGDTIYTIGNAVGMLKTVKKYYVTVTKTKLDSSFIAHSIIALDSFEGDSLRGTLLRYYHAVALKDRIFHLGVSLVGNGKRDKLYLAKYSSNGFLLDTLHCTKDSSLTSFQNILFVNNQPVICGFYFYHNSSINTKSTSFIQYYRNKKIVWIKKYPDESTDTRWRITSTLKNNKNDRSFFITLQRQWEFKGSPGLVQDYIVKMDTLGNELWRSWVNNRDSINPGGTQIVQKSNGNLLVSWSDKYLRPYKNPIGSSVPQLNRKATVWFAEIDSTGKVLWRKNIKTYLSTKLIDTTQDLTHYKAITVKDGVLWCGQNGYHNQNYLLKTDYDGNPLWFREYKIYPENTAYSEFLPFDITITNDGGYLLTGEYISESGNVFPNGCQKGLIIKVNSNGCLVPGCQEQDGLTKHMEFQKVCKVFPNPASNHFILELPIQNQTTYRIKLFNSQSKIVAENDTRNTVSINTESLSNGIYYLVIVNQTTNQLETHKIAIYRSIYN